MQGIYGSITLAGMKRIFDSLRHSCGFDSSSTLVDIGAGLGRCVKILMAHICTTSSSVCVYNWAAVCRKFVHT